MILTRIILLITVIASSPIYSANFESNLATTNQDQIILSPENPEALPGLPSLTPPSLTTPTVLPERYDEELENLLESEQIELKTHTNETDIAKHSYQLIRKIVDEEKLTDTLVKFKEVKSALDTTDQLIQKTASELKIIQTLSNLDSENSIATIDVSEPTIPADLSETTLSGSIDNIDTLNENSPPNELNQVKSLFNLKNLVILTFTLMIVAGLFKLTSFILLRNPYR